MFKKLLLITIISVLCITVSAQIPQAFKYQAIARDIEGQIISNQNVSLRVSLLQNTQDGEEVFSEIHECSTNNYGLINIAVGEGENEKGIFSSLNWGAGNFYIKVEMDESGGRNYKPMGTAILYSVPYALYAVQAGKIANNPVIKGPEKFSSNPNNGGGSGSRAMNSKISAGSDSYLNAVTGKVGIGKIPVNGKLDIFGDVNMSSTYSLMFDASPVFLVKGSNNLFVGRNAGVNNISGDENAFFGTHAGISNTSGSNSTYVGSYAGQGIKDGEYNVYIGDQSGANADSSKYNTCVGASSGQKNTGNDNTFIGYQSGRDCVAGNYNTFIGSSTGGNSSMNYNTYIGFSAALSDTSGQKNTYIGASTGMFDPTGSENVYIGYSAGNANKGSGNVFIGAYAGGTTGTLSNKLMIGNALGITPLISGDFSSGDITLSGDVWITGAFKSTSGQMGTLGQLLSSTGSGTNWISPGPAIIGGAPGQIQFNDNNDFAGSADLVWDETNKKLGIGITNPSYTVTIKNTSNKKTLRLIGPGSWGLGARITFGDTNRAYIEEDLDDKFYFKAKRYAFMECYGGGNVGIGITDPQSLLEVDGDVLIRQNSLNVNMYNNSGGWVQPGNVVVADTAVDLAVLMSASTDKNVVGVVITAGGQGSLVQVAVAGIFTVRVSNNVKRSDFLKPSSSLFGYAESSGKNGGQGDFAVALSSYTGGNGTVIATFIKSEIF